MFLRPFSSASPVTYGAEAVDVVRFLARHLLLAHSRAAFMRPLSRVELAIARRKTCSDFRLTSHVSHNRTERALQLASQHVVAGAAVLVLPEAVQLPCTAGRDRMRVVPT